MLSYYDTLSFSVRRRSFLVGLCISLLMMALFAGVYFLLERQFAIFSNFKKLLQPTSIASFSESIRRVTATLQDGYFRSVVSQQLLILLLSFLFFNLVFFSWQTISAKKELFQQTSHSSVSFYIVALIEMLALLLPFFACTYLLLSKLLPWCVNYLCDDLLLIKTQPFKFPYTIK